MFTGIIEEVGRLRTIERSGQAMVLTVGASRIMDDVRLGDSIAVNGVCLTVVRYDDDSFTVDVMPETYRKTNLHKLKPGSPVNLERAMPANGRFGGHIVQGHVDGTGVIVRRQKEENAVVFTIRPHDENLFDHIIPRGSIAIDGISLTVVRAEEGVLTVSIIPHTLSETVLAFKHEGATVNIETDVIGKYIAHLIARRDSRAESGNGRGGRTGLTLSMLAENGFI
jgi:riboflavin synthase